jgi:hypothetical protein
LFRGSIGNLGFNRKIKETAEKKPKDFFFFNNGISCLSTALRVNSESGFIEVEDLQVINGAQTLKSLVDSRKTAALSDVTVLVRVTEVGPGYAASGKFIDEITEYNNSQNVIKSSDFRSNDKIQVFLEGAFSKLKHDTKTVRYLRKRTEKLPQAKFTVIKMEDFIKVIHAFLHDPISFSSSTKYLYGLDKGDGYLKVFGDGVDLYENWEPDEFKCRAGIWWLGNAFLKKIREDISELKSNLDAESDEEKRKEISLKAQALQGKWFVIYAARLLLERTYQGDWTRKLSDYYDCTWSFDKKPHGIWLTELYDLARSVVQEVYADDYAQRENFVHRNWLRSKETMESIQRKCRHGARLEIQAQLPTK